MDVEGAGRRGGCSRNADQHHRRPDHRDDQEPGRCLTTADGVVRSPQSAMTNHIGISTSSKKTKNTTRSSRGEDAEVAASITSSRATSASRRHGRVRAGAGRPKQHQASDGVTATSGAESRRRRGASAPRSRRSRSRPTRTGAGSGDRSRTRPAGRGQRDVDGRCGDADRHRTHRHGGTAPMHGRRRATAPRGARPARRSSRDQPAPAPTRARTDHDRGEVRRDVARRAPTGPAGRPRRPRRRALGHTVSTTSRSPATTLCVPDRDHPDERHRRRCGRSRARRRAAGAASRAQRPGHHRRIATTPPYVSTMATSTRAVEIADSPSRPRPVDTEERGIDDGHPTHEREHGEYDERTGQQWGGLRGRSPARAFSGAAATTPAAGSGMVTAGERRSTGANTISHTRVAYAAVSTAVTSPATRTTSPAPTARPGAPSCAAAEDAVLGEEADERRHAGERGETDRHRHERQRHVASGPVRRPSPPARRGAWYPRPRRSRRPRGTAAP